MSIAILCPTRDRLKQLQRMMNSALDGTDDVYIYVYVADNEPDLEAYRFLNYQKNTQVLVGPDYPTVHKWNVLADYALKQGKHDLYMLGADDMYFDTKGWNDALVKEYHGLKNKVHVFALQDSRDQDGTPHPIVTREYIESMGYFLPPIFLHWYCDTWTVDIAKSHDCFTHLKDFMLVHDKPSDNGEADNTFSRIRNLGWRERDEYVNSKCQGLLESEKARLQNSV